MKHMKHSDFRIGTEFECGFRRWRCTDIGTRVIVAIELRSGQREDWYRGPPYAVPETVFDENDIPGCELPEPTAGRGPGMARAPRTGGLEEEDE